MKFYTNRLRYEYGLIIPFCVLLLLSFSGVVKSWLTYQSSYLLYFIGIMAVMIMCAFNIIYHAQFLSNQFVQPKGTMILTLSSVTVEVGMILALLQNKGDVNTIQNTSFALVMLAINGFAALSLIVGGFRYNRQKYNLRGASSYLALMIFASSACFIIPSYAPKYYEGISNAHALVVIVLLLLMYIILLISQAITHRDYFICSDEDEEEEKIKYNRWLITYHFAALLVGLVTMVKLSKFLGKLLDIISHYHGLPTRTSSLIVALLVLLPEGLSAIRASYRNELQKSINLCLGSVVASISITIPTILAYNLMFLHSNVVLGLRPLEQVILGLTYLLNIITFTSGKASLLYGAASFSLLILYLFFALQ